MDASLVMLAARLVQCAPGEVMVARWRGDEFVVVWGIGWKRVFPRAEVDALLRVAEVAAPVVVAVPVVDAVWESDTGFISGGRAQMIEIFPTDDVGGLSTLFPERLVKVLIRAGFASPGAVQRATDEELSDVNGIGPRTLADIRELLPYSQQ